MSAQPEALRLADEYADAVATHRLESLYGTSKSYTLEKARERDEAHDALTAELRRLHDELKECQDQRRAAFRRIEELDRELDAMRAQIGQGEPVAWKWKNKKTAREGVYVEDPREVGVNMLHPDYEWTPLYTHPAPQQKPLTDEQIDALYIDHRGDGGPTAICEQFARAIEAAHGIK